MPADERIKVTFKRIFVLDDADWLGSGEFYFIASVDGQRVGDRSRIFTARERTWINLPAAAWSHTLNSSGKNSIAISFKGMDEDVFSDDDLGTVGHTLRTPWRQRTFRHRTNHFVLDWEVNLAAAGSFARHPPDTVFACRQNQGSVNCTTVSGGRITARVEFHPVLPVPPGLPPRLAFPAGTAPAQPGANNAGTNISPGDPINIVPNPSVIPILSRPGGGAPPANAPPRATAATAARIEFTYYRPRTLAFTDNDPRLEWTVRSIAGGAAVAFIGPARGRKVLVYGTTAGEVVLDVSFQGAVMASYRALVMGVKSIPCRINILNGPTASSQPRASPADTLNHLQIANRFLRQIALELSLDTNATRTHGARPTRTPGIFRIRVSRGTTRRINSSVLNVRATRLNYRRGVMNFSYIRSERNPQTGGAATDFPASNIAAAAGARPQITDSGTPSTSWTSPTGILPDGAAGGITMRLINSIQRPGHPQLFAMFLCDTIGDPSSAAGQQLYAKSLVHELGHILNLGHRVEQPDATTPTGLSANGVFFDGLTHPPQENIMFWAGVQPICQDLDIIQARAAHQSPLVPP